MIIEILNFKLFFQNIDKDMDIKNDSDMQPTQSTSLHDYNTDLGGGGSGLNGNVFQSDDLDDGQYFDDGQDSDTADSDENSLKKQKLV